MTTGHWYVLMTARWCSYCEEMMGHWNRTALELKGEINVAVIDASNAPFTAQRFNVTAYPTVVLLKRGRFWTVPNKAPREWKAMMMYARETGEEVHFLLCFAVIWLLSFV
jgi:hypothetical protein